MEIPVIFRAEKNGDFKGEVTAVFPTAPADVFGITLTVYTHIGQHSGGTFCWYHSTRAAKPEEYAALLAELQAIYAPNKLIVYQRMTPKHRRAFDEKVKYIPG